MQKVRKKAHNYANDSTTETKLLTTNIKFHRSEQAADPQLKLSYTIKILIESLDLGHCIWKEVWLRKFVHCFYTYLCKVIFTDVLQNKTIRTRSALFGSSRVERSEKRTVTVDFWPAHRPLAPWLRILSAPSANCLSRSARKSPTNG